MNDLLNINCIYLYVVVKNQKQAFAFIAKKFVENNFSADEKKCYKGLLMREKESSTGFNEGIAIPHAKIKEIFRPGVLVIKFQNPVAWNSIDNSLVQIAIALAIPDGDSSHDHLRVLSSIARKLIDANFRTNLKSANDRNAIYQLVSQIEIK